MNDDNKVIIVIVVAIGLLVLGALGIKKMITDGASIIKDMGLNFVMSKKAEKEVDFQEVSFLDLNLISTDLEIIENTEDKVLVEYYSNDDSIPIIKFELNTLSINEEESLEPCIGFCNNRRKIELYIPAAFKGYVTINNTSGDITSFVNLTGLTEIKTVSGDVELFDAAAVRIQTTSGDIRIENLNESLELTTTSGDVSITSFNARDNSLIKTTSGDVSISECNSYVDAHTTSGDTRIYNNNRFSNTTLIINTTSGDIDVN